MVITVVGGSVLILLIIIMFLLAMTWDCVDVNMPTGFCRIRLKALYQKILNMTIMGQMIIVLTHSILKR